MYIYIIHNIYIYIYICMYILNIYKSKRAEVEGMELPVVLKKYHGEIIGAI